MNNQQRKNHIRDFGITPLGCRTINVSWAQHDTSTKMCAHFCSPHFSFSAISVIGCSHDNHYFLSWSHKHNTGGRTTHMVAQHMVAQHMWSANTGGRPTQVVVQHMWSRNTAKTGSIIYRWQIERLQFIGILSITNRNRLTP